LSETRSRYVLGEFSEGVYARYCAAAAFITAPSIVEAASQTGKAKQSQPNFLPEKYSISGDDEYVTDRTPSEVWIVAYNWFIRS
jgi:hypothetical protein